MWFIFIRWLKGLWIWSHEIMMFDKFWVTLLCLFETDVVYDPDVIACLVRLLSMLLNCKVQEKHPEVYIASTVRNPQTYDCFKKELGRFHIINNILFYSINVKCFLNSWFPIMNEMFLLFTEMAGLRHIVMKDSVTQVFQYKRASTLEMIKIYVWQKQSLCYKVFIYIIFTRIVCFLFSYSSLSQWHCWNADYPVVGTVSLKICTLCKYLTVTFHWMGVKGFERMLHKPFT